MPRQTAFGDISCRRSRPGRAKPFGPFQAVHLDDGASLDFDQIEGDVASQHYAFLIDEDDFDPIFGRIRERGIPYWADPGKRRAGEIYHHNGGRGLLLRQTPMAIYWKFSRSRMQAAREVDHRWRSAR